MRNTKSERRIHGRVAVRRPSPVRLLAPSGRLFGLAVLENVSVGGVLLSAAGALSPGAQAVLEPTSPPPLAGRRFGFKVSRCEEHAEGGWLVAGEFPALLSENEMAALIGA